MTKKLHPHSELEYVKWQAEVFKQNDRNNKEKIKNEMEDQIQNQSWLTRQHASLVRSCKKLYYIF